jgi:hypothetical protein
VTNASGCSRTSAVKTVVVNTPPVATISPSQHQTACSGQPVTFQANTGSGLSYQWLLSGSNIAGATGSSYIATAAGVYSVIVTNTAGCFTTSDTVGLSYNACGASIVSINPYPNICRGDVVSVSYSAPGSFNPGNIFTAQLSNAAGSFATPVTIGTLTSTTGGTINSTIPAAQAAGSGYRMRIVSSNPVSTGADNGTNLSILIQPTAAQAVITAGGSLSICPGGNVGLLVPSVAGLSYQWKLGANNIAGATGNNYMATAAGAYTVAVTNAAGCSRVSAGKTVSVLTAPTATITPSTAQSLCATGSVSFTANTGAGLSYNWLMTGSGIPGATNNTYNATAAGNYSVQVTNSNGCSAISSVVSVTADCGAVITDAGLRNICSGGGVTVGFTATGFNAGNVFTLQLSDITGSFSTPLDIGTLAASSGGNISGLIPGGTSAGSGYKLRLVSSNPVTTGNASPLTINIQSAIADTVDLCAVTVDSATGKNMLIWNKPLSASIDSFVFYRNTTGPFERVGAQSYSQFSTWIDNSSEPSTLQHGYYITGKNSCGETSPVTSHLTMHLAISQGQSATTWNLSWNGYEGFPHLTYHIWRGTSPTAMALLRDISARDYNSFTDFSAPAGTVYYMVSVADAPSCNPSARTTADGMRIRSNNASNINGMAVAVWPNPATASAQLLVQSKTGNEVYTVRLMDIFGRSVEQFEVLANKEASFGRSAAPGGYMIEIVGSNGQKLISRWVKQ